MTNQERNREALIDHIAEQDRIIRRRNEQIAVLDEIIDEVRRDLADYQAMHSQQIETIARLQKNPRPLTADDITDEMRIRAWRAMREWENYEWSLTHEQSGDMVLRAALTEPTEDPEVVALAEVLGDFAVADEHTGDRDDVILARRLHERGVRVTGTES